MIDRVLGHYQIVSKLGEGGMGVVYRARDQVLRRDVALKFFGQALAPGAREFLLREARAASALSHPNICTVHEVGESGGEFYIVMELIEGETLAQKIARGPLPAAEALGVGLQLAEGLEAAHGDAGLHRFAEGADDEIVRVVVIIDIVVHLLPLFLGHFSLPQ